MSTQLSMNIAYVIDYLYSVNGGTERQLHQLIKGMVSRGHRVRLYVYRQTEFTRNLEHFDCLVECLGIESLANVGTLRKLWTFRRRLIKDHTDVVHGFFNDVALTLPVVLINSGIRIFTSRRDMGIWYSPGKLMVLRCLSWIPSAIICNCEAVAKLTSKREHKNEKEIHVVRSGIEHFLTVGDSSQTSNSEFMVESINAKVTKVVVVANIKPVKRIEDLVAAAAQLKFLELEYWVIGHLSDRDYALTLQEQINSAGLMDRFHFTGPVKEPRALLPCFDIGVLCSESEGLSNTLLEYLDAGLVTVASNVGGNPEIISNGENGFLYSKGSVDELTSILQKLVKRPKLSSSITRRGKKVLDLFSMKNMIKKHEHLYRS